MSAVMIAKCGERVIASIYVRTCVSEVVLELLNRFCRVELHELPAECVFSGVKVVGGVHHYVPKGCTYVEVSQGFYVLQPGFIDCQCFYCNGDISCRFSLQKSICTSRGREKIGNHVALEDIKKLVGRLASLPGNLLWCVDREGKLHTYEL